MKEKIYMRHLEAPEAPSAHETHSEKTGERPPNDEFFPLPEEFLETLEKMGLDAHKVAYQKVLEMSQAIKEAGGLALLVGGSVRDVILGSIPKDFDLEVYKLTAEEIEEIVKGFGKVSEVGKAFGILKISLEGGMDIDVSLPRVDSKIGEGHRGFAVKTDPYMSVKDAARRRDFTINSVATDPLTGEFFDNFDGVKDIKNRILRVTDEERFKDDPLRVMRALQFVGRFGLEIEANTMRIIREMSPQLKELPKERIGEEWKKLLLKSEKPSLGLNAGMTLGIFREIHPEFPPLAETPQEPEWHPEGDVWVHTLMVVDEASKIVKQERLEGNKALTVLLASLCHDIGKPMVTEFVDGRIKSHGHEQAGEEPTKKFLASIGTSGDIRDKVVKLVTNHLIPTMFYIEETVRGKKISDGAIRRLAKRIHPATIHELVLISEADHLGRGEFSPEVAEQLLMPAQSFPAGKWLLERARRLNVEQSRPVDLTRGADWLAFGFKPGSNIGILIKLSNELRDSKDFSREMVLVAVDGIKNPEEAIVKLQTLLNK